MGIYTVYIERFLEGRKNEAAHHARSEWGAVIDLHESS